MKVYIIDYAGHCVGVYSRKKKLLEAYVRKCKKYKEEIIKDLKDAVTNIYTDENNFMKNVERTTISEILNLFQGEEYDSSQFSLEELSKCTDSDYTFRSLEMDK